MIDGVELDFRGWAVSRRGALRRTAFLLSGDWFLADDLVQETLTRLYGVWQRASRGGQPDAYARKVLLNLYLDHKRHPTRREHPQAELPESLAAEPPEDSRTHDQLVAALREVPSGQRAVLVLRFWEDLSVEQTAQALGTSTGNVKSQTSRGLTALREALAEQGLPDVLTGSSHE